MKLSPRYFVVFVFLLVSACLFKTEAVPTDSISTVYKDGEFITYSQVWVDAPKETSAAVIEDFGFQIKSNLDDLFKWALKGMNLRREKNELIEFNFKSTRFNKKTDILTAVGDVVVPHVITIPDIQIDCKLGQTIHPDGKVRLNFDIIRSTGFLKKTSAVFNLIPGKNGCWMTMETRLSFGWFFDLFITRDRYNQIMEWRLKKMIHNIRDEAKLREKNKNKK